MSYCEDCLHYEVCGEEDARDEAMTFCANKLSNVVPIEVLQEVRNKIKSFQDFKCTVSDILNLIDSKIERSDTE